MNCIRVLFVGLFCSVAMNAKRRMKIAFLYECVIFVRILSANQIQMTSKRDKIQCIKWLTQWCIETRPFRCSITLGIQSVDCTSLTNCFFVSSSPLPIVVVAVPFILSAPYKVLLECNIISSACDTVWFTNWWKCWNNVLCTKPVYLIREHFHSTTFSSDRHISRSCCLGVKWCQPF